MLIAMERATAKLVELLDPLLVHIPSQLGGCVLMVWPYTPSVL